MTYNFDTQQWSHFPGRGSSLAPGDLSVRGVGRSRNSPKVKAEGRARGQRASHWDRVRDKLVNPRPSEAAWQTLRYCTESSKSATPPTSYRFDHAVPTTYDDQNRRSPIFPPTHTAFFTLNSALKEAVRIPFLCASLRFLRPSPPRPGRNRKKPEFPES